MASDELENESAILFVGDMHIGRRPEALALQLQDSSIRTQELSPAAAWLSAVQHAIDIGAGAVVLAGDIIDREEDLLEAYYVVERGALRLQDAGIPLIAVAGNHDATLLPRLAQNVKGVQLLGADATWDTTLLEVGSHRVELLGWSFPSTHYEKNPLSDPALRALLEAPGDPTSPRPRARLMVIHGDLDVANSLYAPMTRDELQALPIDAAFLGHIHKPDSLHESRPVGYLGSLVGLNAGETGAHGPVEVRIAPSGAVIAQRIPMAPVRWETLEVDVTSTSPWSPERLLRHVSDSASQWFKDTAVHSSMKVLALRVVLVGRRVIDNWHDAVHELTVDPSRALLVEGVYAHVLVERYVDRTKLAVDLEAIGRERTPAGRLARFLTQPIEPAMQRESRAILDSTWGDESLRMPESFDVDAAVRSAAQRTLERMLDARASGGRS